MGRCDLTYLNENVGQDKARNRQQPQMCSCDYADSAVLTLSLIVRDKVDQETYNAYCSHLNLLAGHYIIWKTTSCLDLFCLLSARRV